MQPPNQKISAESPCIGYCTTVLGDDVCKSCLRTFEEITDWVLLSDDERCVVNARIAKLRQTTPI